MLAIMVGGRNTTAAMEKILMIWFCSILMKPWVESIRKLIFSNRKVAWDIRVSRSCWISEQVRRRSLSVRT